MKRRKRGRGAISIKKGKSRGSIFISYREKEEKVLTVNNG